jgi:hypothetical protein
MCPDRTSRLLEGDRTANQSRPTVTGVEVRKQTADIGEGQGELDGSRAVPTEASDSSLPRRAQFANPAFLRAHKQGRVFPVAGETASRGLDRYQGWRMSRPVGTPERKSDEVNARPGSWACAARAVCHSPLRSDPGYKCLAPLGLKRRGLVAPLRPRTNLRPTRRCFGRSRGLPQSGARPAARAEQGPRPRRRWLQQIGTAPGTSAESRNSKP